VTFTPAEKAKVRRRAAAHKMPMAAYVRATSLGERPQGRSGVAADADAWWDALPPSRRAQVHGWLTRPGASNDPIPGQLPLIESE
jgi:hypothetical protein